MMSQMYNQAAQRADFAGLRDADLMDGMLLATRI